MSEALRARVESALAQLWFSPSPPGWLFAIGVLLRPLSRLTARVATRRRRRARSEASPRADRPVVVIGNLVVGGAGKTPLVIALAKALEARGWHCGLLCSGYRGRQVGAAIVRPDGPVDQHGDEAILLARGTRCTVAAGSQRRDALALLLDADPAIDVVLSDDGLQHHALPRDVEIAVFDRRGIGNGRLLPAGPLREPLEHAREMDAVVVNGGGPAPIAHPRTWASSVEPVEFVALNDSSRRIAAVDFAAFAGGHSVLALAGIASPQRFFDLLRRLGLQAQTRALPDHAHIDRALLDAAGAEIFVMTEKDAVKCEAFDVPNAWWLRVEARFPPALTDWLEKTLRGQATH